MILHRFSELIGRLDGLDGWFESLGIRAKHDRIHAAIRTLKEAEARYLEQLETKQRLDGDIDNFHFGMVEAMEFINIFEQFRNEPKEVIAPIIKRALEGPHRPIDENGRNGLGRNTMFELAFAAKLKTGGAQVELVEPDLRISLEGREFLIACKRPLHEKSIHANVREAAQQLETHLKQRPQAHGIIAISANRIFNAGDKVFVTGSEDGKHRLGDALQLLMGTHERSWLKKSFPARVSAVLFDVMSPAMIGNTETGSDSFVMVSYSVVTNTLQGASMFPFVRHTLPKYLPIH